MEAAKFKYKDLNGFAVQSVITKLDNLHTTPNNASKIRRIIKLVREATAKMQAEYKKELMEKFAVRDEAGKIVEADGQPFTIADDKIEEFTKAQEDFGEREVELAWTPLDAQTIAGAQVSSKELDALGGLYSEVPVGPGLPAEALDGQGNVHNLRK